MNEILLIILATLATAGRVVGLTLLSILVGWFLAYGAIKGRIFESIYVSFCEIFESIPVISFFPVVLLLFITRIGGVLGVELASDFLVFTAVVWNIWLSEYQAFKTIPKDMTEVGENYRMGFFGIMRNVYIPFSIPRIVANLFPSISDGFFYITVSEVFSVGVVSYTSFGIGTVMSSFIFAGNFTGIYLSFLILGVVLVAIIYLLRKYSKYAIARYALDTDTPVIRRGRFSFRNTTRRISIAAAAPLTRLSRYYRRRALSERYDIFEAEEEHRDLAKYIEAALGLILLAGIIYFSATTVISVSGNTWQLLFSQVPTILIGMVYDYARVAVVIAVSFAVTFLLGYYLATHLKAEALGIPAIQILTAFPAPIYFPFIYVAFYPYIHAFFGNLTNEFFVLALAFVSTFYYLFYSFWMGIKAMPEEYSDLTKNLHMGYFSKMRRVILPSTFPYLVSGVSATINSTWGGLMIGEYWPSIYGDRTLSVSHGLMQFIDISTRNGNISSSVWASFLFGIVVVIFSILFTRRMMDLARKKYVAEEGVYSS